MTKTTRKYSAGVWEQGRGFVAWSRHATFEAAKKAAVKYAKSLKAATGGALSWSGGVRSADGTVWFDRVGKINTSEMAM